MGMSAANTTPIAPMIAAMIAPFSPLSDRCPAMPASRSQTRNRWLAKYTRLVEPVKSPARDDPVRPIRMSGVRETRPATWLDRSGQAGPRRDEPAGVNRTARDAGHGDV